MPTGATIRRKSAGLDALTKRLAEVRKLEVAMGYPKEKAYSYPDGTPVVEVAAAHVFGVGVIERDFMALAKPKIMEQGKEYLKKVASLSAKDADAAMALLEAAGQMGVNEIRSAIINGAWPPLSDFPMSAALRERVAASWGKDIPPGMSYRAAKLKFKGSDKPLVDTGVMAAAAVFVVRERAV